MDPRAHLTDPAQISADMFDAIQNHISISINKRYIAVPSHYLYYQSFRHIFRRSHECNLKHPVKAKLFDLPNPGTYKVLP